MFVQKNKTSLSDVHAQATADSCWLPPTAGLRGKRWKRSAQKQTQKEIVKIDAKELEKEINNVSTIINNSKKGVCIKKD